MKKKTIIAMVAIALVLVCAIGGTVAWLVDSTEAVKNTFTFGDINITLTETTGTNYEVYPGAEVAKDPTVTVKANSEACWLFVEVAKSANFDTYMTSAIADGWTELEAGVYYREVAGSTADQPFAVLAGNKVTVKGEELTKEVLAQGGLTADISFTAYAVQKDGFATAALAWDEVK